MKRIIFKTKKHGCHPAGNPATRFGAVAAGLLVALAFSENLPAKESGGNDATDRAAYLIRLANYADLVAAASQSMQPDTTKDSGHGEPSIQGSFIIPSKSFMLDTIDGVAARKDASHCCPIKSTCGFRNYLNYNK